jgi:uncharacterized protein (DUF1697 family)
MTQYVALFRGINVGGKHIVPMQDLRDILGALDCDDVKTYIQSGNAVFSSAASAGDLSAAIMKAIDKQFGFEPQVLVLTADRFREIAAENPYMKVISDPKFIHIAFHTEEPGAPNVEALNELQSQTEEFELKDGAFYLHAPDGIGRSKLAASIDRCLGVATTGRNWRTVTKLIELLS